MGLGMGLVGVEHQSPLFLFKAQYDQLGIVVAGFCDYNDCPPREQVVDLGQTALFG